MQYYYRPSFVFRVHTADNPVQVHWSYACKINVKMIIFLQNWIPQLLLFIIYTCIIVVKLRLLKLFGLECLLRDFQNDLKKLYYASYMDTKNVVSV